STVESFQAQSFILWSLPILCDQRSPADSFSLQQAKPPQKPSQSEAIAGVHSKQRRGRAAHGCLADEVRFVACEMIFPSVASRMKEPRDLPGLGINPSEVRALMEIALRAGEREIVRIVRAAVLPGDDVFDVKTESGKLFRQTTIFAAVSGALPDKLAGHRVHQAGLSSASRDCASALRRPNKVFARTMDSSSSCSVAVSLPSVRFSASSS